MSFSFAHVNGFVWSGGLMHAQKGRLKKAAFRTLGGTVGGLRLMDGSRSVRRCTEGEWGRRVAPDIWNMDA